MQRLFIRLALLTLVLVASGAGSTKTAATAATAPAARQELYYWYLSPIDLFNDENTISAEIFEWWVNLDCEVDQNPSGGILLENGYTNNVYPHNFPPSVFLYYHLTLLTKKPR
jgi:hypothetical protein